MTFRLARRAAWGIADQAFSSITNFAIGIYVASQTSTLAFGAFGLAFVTYLLALNMVRAVVAQPLLIRHSSEAPNLWPRTVSRAAGAALAIGGASGAACLIAGAVMRGHLGEAFLALGLSMPGLLLQDTWRFAFFAQRRDKQALINDAVWAAVLIPIFGGLLFLGSHSVFAALLGWGLAANVAALVGGVQTRVVPRLGDLRSWFEEHSDLVPQFAAETLARLGSMQVTYYLVGLIGGILAVGIIRAGELVLIGPFNVFFQGVNLIALPEATRALRSSSHSLVRWCRILSLVMAAAAVLWGVASLALPDAIGRTILGESWDPAKTVLPAIVVSLTGLVIGSGAIVGLKALGAADAMLRVALLTSMFTLVATSIGTWLGGAPGAAWAMAGGSWFGAGCAWLALVWAVNVPRVSGSRWIGPLLAVDGAHAEPPRAEVSDRLDPTA